MHKWELQIPQWFIRDVILRRHNIIWEVRLYINIINPRFVLSFFCCRPTYETKGIKRPKLQQRQYVQRLDQIRTLVNTLFKLHSITCESKPTDWLRYNMYFFHELHRLVNNSPMLCCGGCRSGRGPYCGARSVRRLQCVMATFPSILLFFLSQVKMYILYKQSIQSNSSKLLFFIFIN